MLKEHCFYQSDLMSAYVKEICFFLFFMIFFRIFMFFTIFLLFFMICHDFPWFFRILEFPGGIYLYTYLKNMKK